MRDKKGKFILWFDEIGTQIFWQKLEMKTMRRSEFLIRCEIDSVSLNPDAVVKTLLNIDKIEKNL